MENQNSIQKEKQMHTALAVIENESDKNRRVKNEDVQSSKRGGRKGAARAAQSLDFGDQGHSAQFRVVIGGEANASLESATARINEGFEAGTVTKSEVANYVFINLPRLLLDAEIKSIRAQHFDDKKMLNSLLKNEEDLPEELKKAIRAHFGVGEREKKKTTRAPSDLSTNFSVDKSASPHTVA